MSLHSAPYWWVVCDSCGARIDYGEFSAMADAGQANDCARDSEWSVTQDGEGHHCPMCPRFCKRCDGDAGEDSGERDYHCQPCWDELEAPDAVLRAADV